MDQGLTRMLPSPRPAPCIYKIFYFTIVDLFLYFLNSLALTSIFANWLKSFIILFIIIVFLSTIICIAQQTVFSFMSLSLPLSLLFAYGCCHFIQSLSTFSTLNLNHKTWELIAVRAAFLVCVIKVLQLKNEYSSKKYFEWRDSAVSSNGLIVATVVPCVGLCHVAPCHAICMHLLLLILCWFWRKQNKKQNKN